MISDDVITLTDPVWEGRTPQGPVARLFLPLIRDERDLPFIKLSLLLSVVFIPFAVYLFLPGQFRWWLAPVYWGLFLWFIGPFILMLHNTSHRILFRKEYDVLNRYIPWVIGPFLGQSPETYFVHHIGMHHSDGNLPDDLSSTMPYQRDSFVDWLRYAGRFLFLGDLDLLVYMLRRRRTKLAVRFVVGEGVFLAVIVGALFLSWQAALVVFVVPTVTLRLLLMTGNWAQHAFVDHDDPTNDWRTVVTFVNSPYNRRCFNDGYHLGHHLRSSRHWLDMPADLLDKRERMVAEGSLVFRRIDYFLIFLLLMLKRYRTLARYHVDLDPAHPRSEDEVIALIKRRLRRFSPEELAAIRAGVAPAVV